MYKLDWSLFGPKIFRIDKITQKVEFFKQVITNEPIYTTKVQVDLLTDKQVICNYLLK